MDHLLNWLVQGGLVALTAAAALRVMPRSRTRARLALAWSGLLVVAALPALPQTWSPAPLPLTVDNTPASLGPVVWMPVSWWTSSALAVAAWIAWSSLYAARIVADAVALRTAKAGARGFPVSRENRLPHWSSLKTAGRRARLVLSHEVRAAAVFGWGSPVIAVAPELLDQLGDADLDRVIIHEWAHVQRRDDVAQFLQLLVRMFAGWHPAVLWLDRQLVFEREVACDEMAVAVCGSARGYATCLTTLAALPRAGGRTLPVLAAVSSSGLRRRLARILAARDGAGTQPWRALSAATTLTLVAIALSVCNLRVVDSAVVAMSTPAINTSGSSALAAEVTQPPRGVSIAEAVVPESSPRDTRARSSDPRVLPSAEHDPPPRAAPSLARRVELDRPVEPASSITEPVEGPLVALTARAFGAHAAPALPVESQLERGGEGSPLNDATERTPWSAAANAGIAIGRGSRGAGLATGGFFSRLGKKIAGSF